MRIRLIVSLALLLHATAFAFFVSPAQAAERVALVIGNGAYQKVPALPNPPRDADDMAASLGRLGFSVSRVTNANGGDMRKALIAFGRAAAASEMAVVFYAGHGIEVGGENWLIPVDAELQSETDTESEAISLKAVTQQVAKSRQLGLVILDACRSNPFDAKMQRLSLKRDVPRGFARVEPVGNVLIAYAAKDGTTANDGDGRNSPFTAALLRNIETPGLEINFLFRNVRDDVMSATRSEQQPFVYGSLSKTAIYLKPGNASPSVTLTQPPPAAISTPADEVFWDVVRGSEVAASFEEFLKRYPASARAEDARARLDSLKSRQQAALAPLLVPSAPVIPPVIPSAVTPISPVQNPSLGGPVWGSISLPARSEGEQFAITPDSRRIIFAAEGRIQLADLTSGNILRSAASSLATSFFKIAVSKNGSWAAVRAEGKIELFDLQGDTPRLLKTINGSNCRDGSAFSPDGRYFAATEENNRLGIYEMPGVNLVRKLDSQSDCVGTVRFSPDGKYLATGASPRLVLWDVNTGKLIRELVLPNTRSHDVRDIAFSPDGARIAAVSAESQLAIWQMSDGRLLTSEGKADPAKDSGAYSIAYAPDGKYIVVGGSRGLRFWKPGAGKSQLAVENKSYVSFYQVAFSPDGTRLLAATSDNLYHFAVPAALSGVAQQRQ